MRQLRPFRARGTDPEFVERFDNFAFDEVIAYGNLSTQTRLKVTQC